MEGIVDPALADVGGSQALRRIIATGSLDIVHHQIEGCGGTGFQRLFRFSHDDMRAATKLKDCELSGSENRSKADGFEPLRGSCDIGSVKSDVADRYRWSLIDSLRHDFPILWSAIQD